MQLMRLIIESKSEKSHFAFWNENMADLSFSSLSLNGFMEALSEMSITVRGELEFDYNFSIADKTKG